MIYFLALIPATALTVAGYFVLFLSNRSEGSFRAFGKYLGFWAFTLAGLVVLGAIFAAAHGGHCGAMLHARAMGFPMYGGGPGYPAHFGTCACEPHDAYTPNAAPAGAGPAAAASAPPGAPPPSPSPPPAR